MAGGDIAWLVLVLRANFGSKRENFILRQANCFFKSSFSRRFYAIVLLILLSFSGQSFALDMNFTGSLETNFGFSLPYTENPWKIIAGSEVFDGRFEAYGSGCTLNIEGSITFDALQAVYGEKVLDYISSSFAGFAGRLKEAYFDYDGSWWGIRIGRQIVTWGAADAFTVSNVLCPQNLTVLTGTDITDTMLGIDAVKLTFNFSSFSADLYWIPFFTPSKLPLAKSNILNSVLLPQSVDLSESGLGVLGINSFTSSQIEYPEISFESGEYAAKFSAYTSFADFTLYGFYGWEDMPAVSYLVETESKTVTHPIYGDISVTTPSSITLHGNYSRLAMMAVDTTIPAGPITVRIETAYFPLRYFATSAENQIKNQLEQILSDGTIDYAKVKTLQQNHQLIALAGLDWIQGDWTVTAQYYADFVFGTEQNPIDALSRKFFEHKTSVSLGYSAFSGVLDLSVSGIIGWNDFDSVIVPEIVYSLNDNIAFSLIGYFFQSGKGEGSYGAYKNLSSIMLKGSFWF